MSIEQLQILQQNLEEKIAYFRGELVIESSADAKFELKKRLEEAEGELDRIRSQISQAYRLDTPESQESLVEKIRMLSLDEIMAEIHLVNCNREKVIDKLWDAFDAKSDQTYQYYFICGCRKQMPPSTAERFVYDLINDELDEDWEAINYLRKQDSNRVDIDVLALKNNQKRTQKKFIKQLASRFEHFPHFDLGNFIKMGIPSMKESYVVSLLTLDESSWKDFTGDFFRWVMNKFSHIHPNCPTFQFFFVIYLDDFCDQPLTEKQQDILDTIDQLVVEFNNACSMHAGIGPVTDKDLINWFDRLGETNVSRIDSVIETFVRGLEVSYQQRFHEQRLFDMAHVEILLQKVYEVKEGG